MRPFMTIHHRRARLPIATLAVAALVGALSTVSLPAAPVAAGVASGSARVGVPAGFLAGASAFVPHSSMVYVLGTAHSAGGNQLDVLRIYHGKTTYSVVKTTVNDQISSIAAGSSSAVWLAGNTLSPDDHVMPLILRKTGNSWTAVKLPAFSRGAVLNSISASSATNAWAAGHLPTHHKSIADVLHWNGKTWKAVDDGQQPGSFLNSVSTSSPTNVWAIEGIETHGKSEDVLIHWNGRRWSTHNPAAAEFLVSVATLGRKRVWAVGSRLVGQPGSHVVPFAVHLQGSRWVTAREPKFRAQVSLTEVAMRGSSVWAVGLNVHEAKEYLLHSCGKAWRVVPTRQWGNVANRDLFGISAGPKATALALGTYVTATSCQNGRIHGLMLVAHVRSTHRIDPTVVDQNECG
jgi:hypothetical protein